MSYPRTTFANGTNPFQCLGAMPSTKPEPTMQKPARKNAKRIKDEDYSTPYKPPVAIAAEPAPAPRAEQESSLEYMPALLKPYVNPDNLEIRDDPLPDGRASPKKKYHPLFDRMKPGQSVRCASKDVGKVSNALRKYLSGKGSKCQTKSTLSYLGDAGYGRVWMLALPVRESAKA